MKMQLSQALILVLIQGVCNSAKLPSSFRKCNVRKYDYNKCLGKSINDAIRQLYKPLRAYGLPSLGIFYMPECRSEFGNSEDGLRQVFRNFTFYGLANPISTKANMDFEANTLQVNITYPEIAISCDYEAHGSVTLLPLNMTTEIFGNFIKSTIILTFELEEFGEAPKYYRILTSKFGLLAEGVTIEFLDLFQNQRLNDAFNAELSENGVQSLAKYQSQMQIYAPYFAAPFNNLLQQIPKHELFDGF